MAKPTLVFLILFFLLASLAPSIYEYTNRTRLSQTRSFELVHNFPTDYNFYLSRIRQGLEGRMTVVERYTTESHRGSFVHVFYLILGWIGKMGNVPLARSDVVYHGARIVFAVALLWAIGIFVGRFFAPTRIWEVFAFLFAVTASTWPKLVFFNDGWRFGGFMPWWSVMDSLQRIAFIPHLLLGQALMLILVIILSDVTRLSHKPRWTAAGILAFILGVIFPPGLIFVWTTVVVMVLFEWFGGRKSFRGFFVSQLPRVYACVCGAPAFLYLTLVTSLYPWKRLAEFDIIKPLPFDYGEYFLAVGYMLPLGIAGLIVAIARKEKKLIPVISWVVAWLFLLGLFKFIPSQSPLRFSEMIPHIPLGILTAYVLYVLSRKLRVLSFSIAAILVAIGFGVMFSSWLWQRDFVDHKTSATFPLVPTGSYVMYPLKDFVEAIEYIRDQAPGEVVLSETAAGNYIPVIAGNTVFVGHDNTVAAEQKQLEVKAFFSGSMDPLDASAFLQKNGIGIIFFGPQEMEDGGVRDLLPLVPNIETIFENSTMRLYHVL